MSTKLHDEHAREDEAQALEAIFAEDFRRINGESFEIQINKYLVLRVLLPEHYPSECSPLFELHETTGRLSEQQIANISKNLDQMASENVGEVIVFRWVEYLREREEFLSNHNQETSVATNGIQTVNEIFEQDFPDIPNQSETSTSIPQLRKHPSHISEEIHEKWSSVIISGDILVDRKSTFQAHVAPVQSIQQVSEMLQVLKSNNKIARATHNIMAYRILREEGCILSDCDDDGESAAGGRLLHLLDILGVKGACVVVSRWYGGIQLGPDRFKHINNVARALLCSQGYVTAADSPGDPGRRRR